MGLLYKLHVCTCNYIYMHIHVCTGCKGLLCVYMQDSSWTFIQDFLLGGNLTSTISCIQKLMYTNPKLHHLIGGIYVSKEIPKAAF